MDFVKLLNNEIVGGNIKSINDILKLRDNLARKLKPKELPSLITIFAKADKEQKEYLRKILKTKPNRTLSGVAPVAVMTMPSNCPPQAKCTFCPGGLKSQFGDTPKSYTGNEPASMRARRNLYDPYLQVFNRLEHYILLNQDISKCEVIVMGGTFTSFAKTYQEYFVKYIFKAMNDFSKLFFNGNEFDYEKFSEFFELDKNFKDSERIKRIIEKVSKLKKECDLRKEQRKNEKSNCRIIGLTLETRPDCVNKEIGNFMLNLGATRIELGIQSLDDDVLKFVKRGHGVKESAEAIKLLKDFGFKLNLHYMIFYYGKKELDDMKKLFSDPDYRPDALKIYPCMVLPGTKLEQEYLAGRFQPLDTEEATEMIVNFKKIVPEYCRIMRVQRDIPTTKIIAGVDKTNLRQYMEQNYKFKCHCIRCREAKGQEINWSKVKINIEKYVASKGQEFFISVVDTSQDLLIRQLHVYGTATGLGQEGAIQHRGWGKKLLQTAEELAKKKGKNKLVVISGIGVREYYKKLGYVREGVYMVKEI